MAISLVAILVSIIVKIKKVTYQHSCYLKMPESHVKRSKCYHPDTNFVQYIWDELRMKEIRRTRENAGEELSGDEKRFERNLDKRKSTWMNKIFQRTADLIFFLECVASKPELREEFKDEYDDLFGLGVNEEYLYYSTELYKNSFYRLVSSILQTNNMQIRDTSLTATYIAQEAVYRKMQNIVESAIRIPDPEIANKILDDIGSSMAWIKFVSLTNITKTHFRREIDSHNPVVQDTKSS